MGLLMVSMCATAALAQSLPRIVLKPANGMLDADFVALTSLREVADGRVIVTDGQAQQLYVGDFATKAATPLGRRGKGPLEWIAVGRVHPSVGDSSIMSDIANRRWLLFDGASVVGTRRPDDPAVRAAGDFRGVDRLGHVMSARSAPMTTSGTREYTRRDSQVVLLVDRASGRTDTVARTREMPRRYSQTVRENGALGSFQNSRTEAGAQGEEAYLCGDGTLAVVRLEPLRVDWRAPDGRWTFGKPLPLRGEPVDAKERAQIAQQRKETRAEMRRLGLPAPSEPPLATTLPALRALRPIELPDGRIALQRASPVSKPAVRYVIVNRRGTIDGEITLQTNEYLLGFGSRSVYISVRDDDDVERLRRHPWP